MCAKATRRDGPSSGRKVSVASDGTTYRRRVQIMTIQSDFLVAQLGARMHYAVPRILHRAGRLDRLFTDIAASRGLLRLTRLWPASLRPNVVTRLLGRTPPEIPTS